MQSKATTPDEYIAELSTDRKEAMIKLRKEVLKNLPKGFKETKTYGMMQCQEIHYQIVKNNL